MKRISHIEGLRAYLAFWVVFDHILAAGGYGLSQLGGLLRIIRSGWYAVDVFIIISGFVIFYLLDHHKESYKTFITRRFFRLWPLFIFLFAVGIPVSLLTLSNVQTLGPLFPDAQIGDGQAMARLDTWWENIGWHVALHVPMLHGVVPESVLPFAPSAFLGPAWSISLEWQFYLIAPFVFAFLTSRSKSAVTITCAASVLLFMLSPKLPEVQFGAFLPMHVEFFFLGGLSYFAFKWIHKTPVPVPLLPIGIALATFLYVISVKELAIIPISLWIVFFTLLCDLQNPAPATYTRWIGWVFDNPVSLYLGKISYSIYLSHSLVIVISQWLLLKYFASLSQKAHLLGLGVSTCILTLIVSHLLYRFIEIPGMRIGKVVANRMVQKKLQAHAPLPSPPGAAVEL